ncbi:acetyl-CoA carboxylase biotin carboxyl carrier protein [Streptomyces sp. 7N604]|uniref:acetyl-CoA carboxylase biotin carboxyl carrier protein n=1 Tax=Streptomyces sp. 7N604 TaxID=3457415 RepID=UPI003FD395F1
MTLDASKQDHHENGQRPSFTGNGFAGHDLTHLAHTTLDSVCRSVMELARAAPRPPLRIKLQQGHMTVEMEWPDTAAAVSDEPPEEGVPEAGPPPVAPVPVAQDAHLYLLAPTVGTFYHAPEPGAPPFVSVGDVVRPGQPIGILEVMKMMSTIEAEAAGRVVELLVQDGCSVEFQQRLVALEPLSEAEV